MVENQRSYLLRADELKRLRVRKGLSITELAARCDVNYKTVRRWLKGGPAYMDNIAVLTRVLGTTPEQIIITGVFTQADAEKAEAEKIGTQCAEVSKAETLNANTQNSAPQDSELQRADAQKADATPAVGSTRQRKLTVLVLKFGDSDDAQEADLFSRLARELGTGGSLAAPGDAGRFAGTLGAKPSQVLIASGSPPAPVADAGTEAVAPGAPKRRRRLTVALVNFDDLDDRTEDAFLANLARIAGLSRPPEATDVEPSNSIVITLELDPEDDERLVAAFLTGQLGPLGVTRLQDADTGTDVSGAVGGVHFFAPDTGQNYMTMDAIKPKTRQATEEAEKKD
jgi:transcriptional regulator with XRE-family HTH domain